MPSLMRFLTVLAALAAAVFVTLYSLATFVTPQTREMTVTIPSQRLKPPSATAAARNPQTAGAEAAAEGAQAR